MAVGVYANIPMLMAVAFSLLNDVLHNTQILFSEFEWNKSS